MAKTFNELLNEVTPGKREVLLKILINAIGDTQFAKLRGVIDKDEITGVALLSALKTTYSIVTIVTAGVVAEMADPKADNRREKAESIFSLTYRAGRLSTIIEAMEVAPKEWKYIVSTAATDSKNLIEKMESSAPSITFNGFEKWYYFQLELKEERLLAQMLQQLYEFEGFKDGGFAGITNDFINITPN